MKFIGRWRNRVRIMVRYRLLALISIPTLLTLVVLITLSLYWTLNYAWKTVLTGIEADLAVASNSMLVLQREQRQELKALADSYAFRQQLLNSPNNIEVWAHQQASNYGVDYLSVYSAQAIERLPQSLRHPLLQGYERTFFQKMSEIELQGTSSELAERARISILGEEAVEVRGLISRSLLPLFNEKGELTWIIDGIILLNSTTWLVDAIRDLVFPSASLSQGSIGTVTLFLNDVRVSTNVPLNSQTREGRAIGTRVSDEVNQQVLRDGEVWINRAYVHDDWYISAYKPIRDFNNNVIGMLYTGYLEWPLVKGYVRNIIELSLVILVILAVFGVFVYRAANNFFEPLDKIQRAVRLVRFNKRARIGDLPLDPEHELAILARQFDSMLDQLDTQNEAIHENALALEDKVNERTASLLIKTQQLKNNIRLLEKTRNKLLINEKLAALGELTAGIAHEINNPAAVILGNIELIERQIVEGDFAIDDELNAVKEQIERIKNITASLLQYSRHGGIQNKALKQGVNAIIEESVTLIRSGTQKENLQIDCQLNATLEVEVNRHQLLQVLVNLQMNGFHAMDDEGRINIRSDNWLSSYGQALGVTISVQDFGCGISKENLTKIFDPFFTTRSSGTGLGLSVTQGIISGIGGDIKVESDLGQGSTFTLYLYEKSQLSSKSQQNLTADTSAD